MAETHTTTTLAVDSRTRAVLEVHAGRMAGDGVHAIDLEEVMQKVENWEQWYSAWAELGDKYERHADEAVTEGFNITAGEYFWHACISYHYGQFLFFDYPDLREAGQKKKQQLYDAAAPYLVPKAERFVVPIDDVEIPGFLRFPEGQGPFPTVVLLGGLESTKEESYLFENMLLRRGVATCAFDGPGQGEMWFQRRLQPDFERYTAAVVDWLATDPRIDSSRLGILGRSLGGYYAVRSAATNEAFRACVTWGGLYDISYWDRMPELTRKGFQYVSGFDSGEKAARFLREVINLSDVAPKLRGKLLIVHGALDDVMPLDQAERLIEDANQADQTVWIRSDGNHCCHNLYPTIRPAMADWLMRQITA